MDEFDETALALADRAFEIQGFDFPDSNLNKKYILALYLLEIRGLTPSGFVEYIDANPDLRIEIGLQENINQSTIHRKKNHLEDEYPAQLDSIKRAAKRTVWSLSVQDVEVPTGIQRTHGIPESDLCEISIPNPTHEDAIKNWVEYLLTVVDPLTFDRENNDNMHKFIGLSAHCALQNIAPNGADNTVSDLYDDSGIPSGRTLLEYIRRIERNNTDGGTSYPNELVSQFADCFNNFIDLVVAMGFCTGQQQLAIDTTPIPTTTSINTDQTVGGSGSGRSPATYGTRSFRFQYTSIVGATGNFVISVEPYCKKNQKADRLDNQLARVVKNTKLNIDHISLDKEYYEKEVFKSLRRRVGEDWVVCAKRTGEITQLISDAKEGNRIEMKHVEIGQPPLTPRLNAFAYPLSENKIGNAESIDKKLSEFNDNTAEKSDEEPRWDTFTDKNPSNEFIAYVTDMDLTDTNKRKLHVCYRNRRQIEPIIGQIRSTYLPYTESMDSAIRYYFMALGTLFYNFHQLINNHPSPEYGVPLEITGKEWLSAIRNMTLSA
jgi:hypothetical protein